KLKSGRKRRARWIVHLSAISSGGLVIWIPAMARPHEMESLLRMIVPGGDPSHAEQIVWLTRWIAAILCPVAFFFFCWKLQSHGWEIGSWVPLATVAVAGLTPILVSFTAYFCLWHSLLGLSRLQIQEGLASYRFIMSILPLSAVAVAGVIAVGWFLRPSIGMSSIVSLPASLQTLFIGLSAIAVPHVLLHEWADLATSNTKHLEARL
ncbi:MAG: Brp/Blh family beta-carotene 15,15'-dioxygenase, partial [Planctomycetes bacterium]|nr:Brp/Blh family beta-carotene 15,15'-dioxygenase [Planctomycetota bacterium]